MLKKGFTLSELLVTLVVVAIASVVLAPAITDIVPDKNKKKVIDAYNLISEINQKLLSSTNLYYDISEIEPDGNIKAVCIGLECENKPEKMDDSYDPDDFSGNTKYRSLFYLAKGESVLNNDSLVMSDGSLWNITRISDSGEYDISIDVNGANEGKNCSYSGDCRNNPDTYIFYIDRYGRVSGKDPLTQAYLKNPTNMHNKRDDYEEASNILSRQEN